MKAFFKKNLALWTGLLVLSGSAIGSTVSEKTADPVVGRINNQPVTAGEYRLIMLREASGVFSQLKAMRDLDDHFGYWKDGGEPLAKLRETVRDELVRIKVRQELARKRGLVQDIDFETFVTEYAAENARRKEAVARGEAIYGPISFSPAASYYARFGDLSFRLTDLLTREAEPTITDEQVEKIYRDRREEFGDKKLEDVRTPIRAYLAKTRAEEQIQQLCAAAKVEMDPVALQGLVPRLDAENPAKE